MEKNILELKVNNKDKDLEGYLKPQWSWKTLLSIVFKTDSLSTLTPFTFETALLNAFFKAISKVSPVPFAVVSIYLISENAV